MRALLIVAIPAIVASLTLAGCGFHILTADGREMSIGSDAFRAYAEAVFREQNEIATELTFLLEREDLPGGELVRLEEAEDTLLEACASLNEIAVRRREGAGRRLFADREAALTVPDCERAARAAARVVQDTAP